MTDHNFPIGTSLRASGWVNPVTVIERFDVIPETAIPVRAATGANTYVYPHEVLGVEGVPTAPEPADEPNDNEVWNLAAISLAAEFGRPVNFLYQKPGGNLSPREVVPERLYESNAGNTVLVGEDTERDEPRTFRLDRIHGYVGISAVE